MGLVKQHRMPIWAVLLLCIALHSHVACAAADAIADVTAREWEDCKTTKMVLLNNYE
jgi:hypothetical protein